MNDQYYFDKNLQHHLFIICLYGLIDRTTQSIAGITYMDDYDVQDRYSNVYECDPFYWHPLHLPEHCNGMFEKLIRSGIGSYGPFRIAKEKAHSHSHGHGRHKHSSYDGHAYDESNQDDTMAPYEKMIELLKNDVIREPSVPEIAYYPGLGPAALYSQAVSKQSGDYIKKVAEAYKEFSFGFGSLYTPTDSPGQDSDSDKDKKNNELDSIINQNNSKHKKSGFKNTKHKKKRPKYNIRKKYRKGDLITVLHTKHH